MVKVGDKVKLLKDLSELCEVREGQIWTVSDLLKMGEPDEHFEIVRETGNGEALRWWLEFDKEGIEFETEVASSIHVEASEKIRKGDKFDSGKPMIRFLSREFLEQTALAQTYGAKKYGHWNFQKGLETTALYDAAMRHLMAWMSGEDNDPESGLPHLGHAAANMNMLIWTLAHKPEMDDRPKGDK